MSYWYLVLIFCVDVAAFELGAFICDRLHERQFIMRELSKFLCLVARGHINLPIVVAYLDLDKKRVKKYYSLLVKLINDFNYRCGFDPYDFISLDDLLQVCFPEEDKCKH